MPYMIVKKGDRWCVYKKDADDEPVGETLGCHDTEKEAQDQLAALYANEPEAQEGRKMRYMRAVRAEADGLPDHTLRFVASTEGDKGDGFDLKMEEWSLDRYLRHPVVLYAHDYQGSNLPIGTGRPFFENRALMIDVTFDADDPFALRVEDKARKGMIAGSVGWDTVVRDKVPKNELLEFSMVPVPMDPAALPVRMRVYDDTTNAVWRGVAVAMADLFRPECGYTDGERRAIYNKLDQLYRLLSREAPEFRPLRDVAAFGEAEYRGLFLEGEPELVPQLFMRVGAMLSARNLADLESARDLIDGVISRAKKEDAQETKPGKEDQEDEDRALTRQLEAILKRL